MNTRQTTRTPHSGAVPNKGFSLTQVHTRTYTRQRFMHCGHGPVNVCASLGVGTGVDLSEKTLYGDGHAATKSGD
jgi:hypothetical protein